MSHNNWNVLRTGILILVLVIPIIVILISVTGLDQALSANKQTSSELVCFDQKGCLLRVDDTWYVVTQVIKPGAIPPNLNP